MVELPVDIKLRIKYIPVDIKLRVGIELLAKLVNDF